MMEIRTILAWSANMLAGAVTGTAFAASLLVLNLVPRLMDMFNVKTMVVSCGAAVTLGAVCASVLQLGQFTFGTVSVLGWFWLFCGGIFVGMLASALSEMLELLPVMVSYTHLARSVKSIIIALMLGKAMGALIAPFIVH